jgi:hypothetical protein
MDARLTDSLPLAMRRGSFDPLEKTDKPRWYVVRNMHGALLEARELPPGAELRRVFVEAILKWMDDGWKLKEFHSRTGTFFCDGGGERRRIDITPSYPGRTQSSGIPQRSPCANCEE